MKKNFPDPVNVAMIAALLRKNEGYHDLVDEAYDLLIKANEYCKSQQRESLGKDDNHQ
tara:strand:- start:4675 stop:4848 length:174 start_codon:yes stop_codon:yes gene_type:complete